MDESFKKNGIRAFLFISFILIAYMMPTYLGWTTLFNDDCMQQSFPRLVAVARQIQRGEIPLWDKNSFSGARPFYSTFETPIYNILLYPFFLAADTNNINQCYFVLFLIPFTLYMIASAFGCYLIGKNIFKLNDIASIVIGISYALSPLYSISFDSLLNTATHTMMIFVILFVVKFIEGKKLKWYLLTILFALFLNLTFQFNYFIRNHFVIGLIIFFVILFSEEKLQEKIKIFLKTATIFLFSTLLISFILAGIFEGVQMLKNMGLKTEDLSDQNSMHPLNIFTLIIPNFFGINDGVNALGLDIDSIWSATTLSGGVFTTIAILAIIAMFFYKEQNKNLKKWSIISLILLFISLISLLGKFTPIYKVFGLILPFIYKIPHPVYFNNLQGLSTAFLAGIGTHIIISNTKIKELIFSKKGTVVVIISLFALVIIMTNIAFVIKGKSINPVFTVNKLIEHRWFTSDPGLYFLFSIFAIIMLFLLKNKSYFNRVFFTLMLVEAIFVGEQVLYERNELLLPSEISAYRNSVLGNYRWPTDSPMYQKLKEIKELTDKTGARFTGSISEIDNLSWVLDNKSLFGYDSKPISIYLYRLINEFGRYDMYEMWNIRFAKRFLQNMNVGFFVSHTGVVSDNDLFFNKDNNDNYYITKDQDKIKKFDEGQLGYDECFVSPELVIYKIPDFLPYIYTNDVIACESEEEQLKKILYSDLRIASCLQENDFNELAKIVGENQTGSINRFNELQNINKIKNITTKYANRIIIDLTVEKNALLVISEIYHPDWKAFVDGKERKVYRVNYAQQGVVVKKGDKKVVLKFQPRIVSIGGYISLITLLSLLVLIVIIKKSEIKEWIKKIH